MKVALRTNFPATARAVQRGLFNAAVRAAHQTADEFGRKSRDSIRTAMVQTGLGKMRGSVRYASSTTKRRGVRATGGTPSRLTLSGQQRAWAYVFNVGGDRSLGTFDVYSARPSTKIRPTGGKRWLAFPVGNFPKRVGRNKITPALWMASGLKTSIGPLVFIKGVSPNVAYLAVKNISVTNKTGGGARALGKRGGVGAGRRKRELVVAFILIRGTTRNRRIDPVSIMTREFGKAGLTFMRVFTGEAAAKPVPSQPMFTRSGTATGQLVPVMRA